MQSNVGAGFPTVFQLIVLTIIVSGATKDIFSATVGAKAVGGIALNVTAIPTAQSVRAVIMAFNVKMHALVVKIVRRILVPV